MRKFIGQLIFRFVALVLLVTLLLTFLSPVCFAKDSKKAWLERLPGRPGRAWLSKEVYLHSSIAYPGVNVSSPIIKVVAACDTWVDLPAKSSNSVFTADITTTTLLSLASTYAETVHTQMDVPRNIGVSFDWSATAPEVAVATNWVYGTCALTGKDARNNTITETVVTTMTTVTYSNNAFSKVTQAVWTITNYASDFSYNADFSNIQFNMGTGDKIGFMGDVHTADECWKVTVDYVDETGSVTVNVQYDTWTHSDVPDASDDFRVYYLKNSETNPR